MADSNETIQGNNAEAASTAVLHDEEEMQKRMAYLLVTKVFYGKAKTSGKTFCEKLTNYNEDVELIFGDQSNKYDLPVLEVVMKHYTDNQKVKETIIKELNETLRNQGHGGKQIDLKDLEHHPFENIDTSSDINLKDRRVRGEIFEKVSGRCGGSGRIIAHFLLDFSDIEIKVRKNPDKVDDTLKEVLEMWFNKLNYNTWPYLRALLLHLNKVSIVQEIEGTIETTDSIR